jgi:hypothetical protein
MHEMGCANRRIPGRCFRSVDSSSDGYPKLIPVDEKPEHQIVHRRGFGKANGATHEPLEKMFQIC